MNEDKPIAQDKHDFGTGTGISSLLGPVRGCQERREKMKATLARLSLLLPLGGVQAPCQDLEAEREGVCLDIEA